MGWHNRMLPDERARAVDLYREHQSITRVAKILGRTKEPIRRVLHKHGIPIVSSAEVQARARAPVQMQQPPPVPASDLEQFIRDDRLLAYRQLRRRQIEREAWPR